MFSRRPRSGNRGPALALTVVTALVVGLSVLSPPAVHGGVGTADPTAAAPAVRAAAALTLERTIRTRPFRGSQVSLLDQEGSAYVPRDGSLWLADDDGRKLLEVNAATGALKRSIGPRTLERARAAGGRQRARAFRTQDLESLAYDRARDVLYAFSGPCCKSWVRPAVFRLTRKAGRLRVRSFRALPVNSDNTASAWHRNTGRVFVGSSGTMRSYSYRHNRFGRAIEVPGLNRILGMDFNRTGKVLHVVHDQTRLSRVRWRTRSLVGTRRNLAAHGVGDARAVVTSGRRLYVSDGDDSRADGDPLRLAVYVFTHD